MQNFGLYSLHVGQLERENCEKDTKIRIIEQALMEKELELTAKELELTEKEENLNSLKQELDECVDKVKTLENLVGMSNLV